jgi:hypothetical protein
MSSQGDDISYPQHYEFNVKRSFENIEYKPTQSVVNYNEKYEFEFLPGTDQDLNTTVKTFNYGGLSVWHQMNNRPDFVNAFKALNQLRLLIDGIEMYGRYFSYNIFNFAYNDIEKVKTFTKMSESTLKFVYND